MGTGGSARANPRKRVPENVPGGFFVDSTCIDCDACRQIGGDGGADIRDVFQASDISSCAGCF